MSTVLPLELIDPILCFVAGPRPTLENIKYYFQDPAYRWRNLCACTLVCRAWLPDSSRLLFEYICVRDSDYAAFLAAARASPRLTHAVGALSVEDGAGVHARLEEILGMLPNLRELEYRDATWPTGAAAAPWIDSLAPHTRARLAGVAVVARARLFIWDIRRADAPSDRSMSRDLVDAAAAPLARGPSTLQIEKVEEEEDVDALNVALYHLGSGVRHLEVREWNLGSRGALDLRSYQRLETVTLYFAEAIELIPFCRQITPFLPQGLRHLTIVCDSPRASSIFELEEPEGLPFFYFVDWPALAEDIRRCKSLETVRILGLCRGYSERLRAELFGEKRANVLAKFPADVAALVTCEP